MLTLREAIKNNIHINEKGLNALAEKFPAIPFLHKSSLLFKKKSFSDFLHKGLQPLQESEDMQGIFNLYDEIIEASEAFANELPVFVAEYCENTKKDALSIVNMSLVEVLDNTVIARAMLLIAFYKHTISKALDFTFETEHLIVEESQNTLIKYGLQEIETEVSWKHFSFEGVANAISRHILIRLSGDNEYENLKKNTKSDFLRLGNAIVTFSYIDSKPSLVGLTESFVKKYLT